jgi:hypothetical protein
LLLGNQAVNIPSQKYSRRGVFHVVLAESIEGKPVADQTRLKRDWIRLEIELEKCVWKIYSQ